MSPWALPKSSLPLSLSANPWALPMRSLPLSLEAKLAALSARPSSENAPPFSPPIGKAPCLENRACLAVFARSFGMDPPPVCPDPFHQASSSGVKGTRFSRLCASCHRVAISSGATGPPRDCVRSVIPSSRRSITLLWHFSISTSYRIPDRSRRSSWAHPPTSSGPGSNRTWSCACRTGRTSRYSP